MLYSDFITYFETICLFNLIPDSLVSNEVKFILLKYTKIIII